MTWVAKDGAPKVPRLRLGAGAGAGADPVGPAVRRDAHPRLGTWPAARGRAATTDGDSAAAEAIPRPQTATLERPRILDIAFLGKIDMTLTRKGYISISSFCLSPVSATAVAAAAGGGGGGCTRAGRRGAAGEVPEAGRRREGRSGRARRGRRGQQLQQLQEQQRVMPPSPAPSPAVRASLHARRPAAALTSSSTSTPTPAPSPSPSPARGPPHKVHSAGNDGRRSREVNNNEPEAMRGGRRKARARGPPPAPPPPSQRPAPPLRGRPGAGPGPCPAALDGAPTRPRSGGGAGGVPEPCTACGRPEQPERFHSHPPSRAGRVAAPLASPRRSGGGGDAERQTKNAAKKPSPVKSRGAAAETRQLVAPATVVVAAPAPGPAAPAAASPSPTRRAGPRTVLCYLCSREFGSASFALHERHCMQRWQRENEQLPPALRRAPPQRPAAAPGADEWNRLAWEASQARLVPCERCGRTFDPDRLVVHARSCKAVPTAATNAAASTAALASLTLAATAALGGRGTSGGSVRPAPTVPCYICGRLFGSASITIHEPQCLDKWRLENSQLPPNQRRPEPIKPEPVLQGKRRHAPVLVRASASRVGLSTASSSLSSSHGAAHPSSTPRTAPPGAGRAVRAPTSAAPGAGVGAVAVVALVPVFTGGGGGGRGGSAAPAPRRGCFLPCHICGRSFGSASIIIHERQCLERWKRENAALPPELRRPEPEKPDIVYRDNGSVDYEGTMEAIWQTHLQQLVPCTLCGRTFYPDRLEVHARACKGPKR